MNVWFQMLSGKCKGCGGAQAFGNCKGLVRVFEIGNMLVVGSINSEVCRFMDMLVGGITKVLVCELIIDTRYHTGDGR